MNQSMNQNLNWLDLFLREHRFKKIFEKDYRPRAWGGGEVDLLAWDERRRVLWVVEIKEHRLCHLGARTLLSQTQRGRLHKAMQFYRSLYPRVVIGFALLWRDPDSGKLEFLENP